MNKILAWILDHTKLGKGLDKSRGFLSGKKTYIAGLALAVPALLTILSKFTDQGTAYLVGITTTPEWQSLIAGVGMMALRAGVTKSSPQ